MQNYNLAKKKPLNIININETAGRKRYMSAEDIKTVKTKEVSGLKYTLNVDIVSDYKLTDKLKEQAGCFVLISNISEDQYSDAEILKIYKEQYSIEKNFGFLKDPLIVNDLFLKKPERIEALGFILVLSLLIWRLLERCTRKYIKEKILL